MQRKTLPVDEPQDRSPSLSAGAYDPILPGEGKDDYARYMQIDALLALQRDPTAMHHHDELLFQITHQTTELWLKLATFEAEAAVVEMHNARAAHAARLLVRGAGVFDLLTSQLDLLTHITPRDFQKMRPALGNGSGVESPGWRAIRGCGATLRSALLQHVAQQQRTLISVYEDDPTAPLYHLCEALVDWDERVGLWRSRHYKLAVRTLGHGTVGTKGMPTDQLARLLNHKFFPELWAVRTAITERAALSSRFDP